MKIAPFSIDEIERFRYVQLHGNMHPYTCGSENRMDKVHNEKGFILDINKNGLFCPSCKYKQNWFHEYYISDEMFNKIKKMKEFFGVK